MAEPEMSVREASSMHVLVGPLLLLGAPGVGKGTQAQRLTEHFQVPQISTGDLLRQHVADGTSLGVLAKRLMNAGQYVPDDLVNGMVAERLGAPDAARGYVLDGFPRTLAQADWLDAELEAAEGGLPLIAIEIQVPEQELLQRITGRRVCPVCRRIYNVYSKPPREEGRCDADGTALELRSDDREDAFQRRMVEFRTKTEGVIEHYRQLGRFMAVPGRGTLDEVERRIVLALRGLRGAGEVGQ